MRRWNDLRKIFKEAMSHPRIVALSVGDQTGLSGRGGTGSSGRAEPDQAGMDRAGASEHHEKQLSTSEGDIGFPASIRLWKISANGILR